MWPNSSSNSYQPSFNTHQMALSNLKERCSKQQKKLDDLEREKLVLRVENETLSKSFYELDQENVILREKNLQLNHRLEMDQDQILDLQRHLDSIGLQNPGTSYNQSPVLSSNNKVTHTETEDVDELLEEVTKVDESMNVLKNALLKQQRYVRTLIENSAKQPDKCDEPWELDSFSKQEDEMEPNNSSLELGPLPNLSHAHVNKPIHQITNQETSTSMDQICPMCEAKFPLAEMTQEDFVSHVNGHFSFDEDSDTLQNYEIIEH